MARYDFNPLVEQYPTIIEQMPPEFTSHQFILQLAQQNQSQYIEALYSYRYDDDGAPLAPFKIVHGKLAKKLFDFPELIEIVRRDEKSLDIFGQPGECALWRKIR